MTWYAAHAIFYYQYKNDYQDRYYVYENIYLIEADQIEYVYEKVNQIAKLHEGDDYGTLVYDGKPACLVFGGIRKIIQCQQEPINDGVNVSGKDTKPQNGTEITYSLLLVRNKKQLKKLIEGSPAKILYIE